jgi:hypothetical protein
MSDTFGQRFINWREYISSMQAFYDAGLTPTQADLDAIAEGSLPPSFWSSPDDMIHLNAKGYTLLGKLIYKRFQILEMIQRPSISCWNYPNDIRLKARICITAESASRASNGIINV